MMSQHESKLSFDNMMAHCVYANPPNSILPNIPMSSPFYTFPHVRKDDMEAYVRFMNRQLASMISTLRFKIVEDTIELQIVPADSTIDKAINEATNVASEDMN